MFCMCIAISKHIFWWLQIWKTVTTDPHDDDADFRYGYRDTIIAQFKQDLYNKIFSLQDQGKGDQIDAVQKRIKFWLNGIDARGDQIPDDIYINENNDEGLGHSVRGATVFPEIWEIKKNFHRLGCKWLRNQLKLL